MTGGETSLWVIIVASLAFFGGYFLWLTRRQQFVPVARRSMPADYSLVRKLHDEWIERYMLVRSLFLSVDAARYWTINYWAALYRRKRTRLILKKRKSKGAFWSDEVIFSDPYVDFDRSAKRLFARVKQGLDANFGDDYHQCYVRLLAVMVVNTVDYSPVVWRALREGLPVVPSTKLLNSTQEWIDSQPQWNNEETWDFIFPFLLWRVTHQQKYDRAIVWITIWPFKSNAAFRTVAKNYLPDAVVDFLCREQQQAHYRELRKEVLRSVLSSRAQ
jgi:hypothetical protein